MAASGWNPMRMLRLCLIEAINALDSNQISQLCENEVARIQWQQRAVTEARKRLRDLGEVDMVADGVWDDKKLLHSCQSVLGNSKKMFTDSRDKGANVDVSKFELWDTRWRLEHSKSQRSKDLTSTSSLPKRMRIAQASASTQAEGATSSPTTGSGMDPILRTMRNHQSAHVVGIPYEAIKIGRFLGQGSYGDCAEVTIEGISFFPPETVYAAKKYKGSSSTKLAECMKEAWMQKVHGSLVRCIAHTTEPPWVTVFPLYNGGNLNSMLFYIPYRESHFRYVVERLERGEIKFRPSHDRIPGASQLARIKGFIENVPNIIHALVDGLKTVHNAGMVHCDLHARNIVLDFTKESVPRVGIIDWGMMLITGQTRQSEEFFYDAPTQTAAVIEERRQRGKNTLRQRPWWAPELCDPLCSSAYSKESDIYAIGWLFTHIIEFWKSACKIYLSMQNFEHPDYHRLMLIEDQINRRMVVENIAERISIIELDDFLKTKCGTIPARAQRPLVELGPTYNY